MLSPFPVDSSGIQRVMGPVSICANRTGFRERETRLNTWKVRETRRETAELYFKCSPSFFTCCSPYYSAPLAHGRDYKADKVIHTTIPAYSETCQSPVMKCRDVDLSMKCAQSVRYIYARCKSYQHIHYSNTYWGQWIYQKHADHHDQNYFWLPRDMYTNHRTESGDVFLYC